jgi:FSR family fosmidomycin resistance protein-like MFS transporter
VFPLFLLVPGGPGKVAAVAALGGVTAAWYPLAKARLFAAMPGASGTAFAVSAIASFIGTAIPIAVAVAAAHAGLDRAMWLLVLGPIGVLVLLPRRRGGAGTRPVA